MNEFEAKLEGLARAIEGSPHNLVGPRALTELRSRHIPECVAFAATLPAWASDVVDIGSGGGLPGLVVAIVRPEMSVTLVESRQKKADFLLETAATLGLGVEVLPERAEGLGPKHRSRYDLATARAVAPLERLIPWALPLLRPGGQLHAIKGEQWADEVAAARDAMRATGGRVVGDPERSRSHSPDAPLVVIIAAPGGSAANEGT